MDIRGIGGRKLTDKWAEGAKTWLGLMTAGFPNLFTVTGPCSPGPLANMSMSIEQHVDWIARCMDDLRRNDVVRIDTTPEREEEWMRQVQEIVQRTLYLKANSWYLGANVPGKPRVFLPYLGGHGNYRAKCDAVAAAGYEGFMLTKGSAAKEEKVETAGAK
jgi:cyclohexanone monooxygenase